MQTCRICVDTSLVHLLGHFFFFLNSFFSSDNSNNINNENKEQTKGIKGLTRQSNSKKNIIVPINHPTCTFMLLYNQQKKTLLCSLSTPNLAKKSPMCFNFLNFFLAWNSTFLGKNCDFKSLLKPSHESIVRRPFSTSPCSSPPKHGIISEVHGGSINFDLINLRGLKVVLKLPYEILQLFGDSSTTILLRFRDIPLLFIPYGDSTEIVFSRRHILVQKLSISCCPLNIAQTNSTKSRLWAFTSLSETRSLPLY